MAILLLCTASTNKLREIQPLLSSLLAGETTRGFLRIAVPRDLSINLSVDEDGTSYDENATRKAKAYHQAAIKRWRNEEVIALADDSGLEIEALGGAPGVHTAHYGPPTLVGYGSRTGDAVRRQYLLNQLRSHPKPWDARYRCTIAVVNGNGEPHVTEGECRGVITEQESGSNGFGFDPVFYLPEFGCTMADLSLGQKNQVSHRALAIRAALPYLRDISIYGHLSNRLVPLTDPLDGGNHA